MRERERRQIRAIRAWGWVLAMIVLGASLAGCEEDAVRDPVAEVKQAARSTLAQRSTVIDVRVTSSQAKYSARGRIELARGRYYVIADFARGGQNAFPKPPIRVVSTGPEAYIGHPGHPGPLRGRRCWFDPHLPIGSAPGIISVQESLALTRIAMRLLANATERVIADESGASGDGGARYQAWVDASAARAKELARAVAGPLSVEAIDGRLRALSLELPRFNSAAHVREPLRGMLRGVEAVSMDVSLAPADRKLELDPPSCIAME